MDNNNNYHFFRLRQEKILLKTEEKILEKKKSTHYKENVLSIFLQIPNPQTAILLQMKGKKKLESRKINNSHVVCLEMRYMRLQCCQLFCLLQKRKRNSRKQLLTRKPHQPYTSSQLAAT